MMSLNLKNKCRGLQFGYSVSNWLYCENRKPYKCNYLYAKSVIATQWNAENNHAWAIPATISQAPWNKFHVAKKLYFQH